VLLVLTVLIVFFALPRWVAESASERAALVTDPEPVEPEPVQPQLSEQELAALAAEAEKLLAQLLSQQGRLETQGAQGWGGDDWVRYSELARTGDDAYLAKAFQDAATAYEQALAAGDALFERSVQSVARALDAARQAFAAGNAELAIAQFDLALGIEPGNEAAKLGRAQAERLPEVLALVQQGDELRGAGNLDDAAEAYGQALSIDATWEPARSALAGVASRLESDRFEALMSTGFTALAEGNFSAAGEQFRAALVMRPNASGARDGLVQAEQGLKLDQIALAEARALAFESRERWNQAIEQYEAALATDPTLAFAKSGLARATARADLDAKLANLIDNPDLLLVDAVLQEARSLREQAGALAEPGPRLDDQKTRLERLLTLAATPLKVELRSDEQTDVTLYRVGPLGAFVVKQVELRPGTYTAIGSRSGYRDVRQTFTVLPGRELPPISVVCIEPI
jgi:tetratricopeptide (TPR) repeat protein